MAAINEVIKLSNKLIKANRYDEAMSLVKPYFNSPYVEDALFQCGKIMINAGRDNEAWLYFNELVYRNESYREEIYFWLAKHKAIIDLGYAKRYLTALISLDESKKIDVMLFLGRFYYVDKRYSAALERYEELYKLGYGKNNPSILLGLARCRRKLGDEEGAIKVLNELISLNLDNTDKAIKEILELSGDIESAESIDSYDVYRKAFKFIKIIDAYVNSGLYAAAMNQCKQLAKLDVLKSITEIRFTAIQLFIEAEKHIKSKNYVEAINCYHKLINKNLYTEQAKSKIETINTEIEFENHIRNGHYTKALNLIEKLEAQGDIYSDFASKKRKYLEPIINHIRRTLINRYTIIAEYIKTHNKKALIEFLKANEKYIDKRDCDRINMYKRVKKSEKSKNKRYKEVINHIIKKHKKDFYDDVDIEKVFYQILEQVDDRIMGSHFMYHVSFDRNIGTTIDGIDTNCIEVAAFMDKTNIMTMYPVIWYGDTIKLDEKVKKLQ